MKKELLELNKEYTYAQMCEIFECEQKPSSNTNGRKSQLKEWETLCKIEKPKRGKYVILEIYEQQKEKIDNRGGSVNKYLPLTEPLLLTMLNQDGPTNLHGEFSDAVVFAYWFDFKELTAKDVKELREKKFKKRISTKFIKECYKDLNLYNFQWRVLVENTIEKLNNNEEWNIERGVKFKLKDNEEELGDNIDRNILKEIEYNVANKMFNNKYITLSISDKKEVKREVIKQYNKQYKTNYVSYQKVSIVDKYYNSVDEYLNDVEGRQDVKERKKYINGLKEQFRRFAFAQLAKTKVETEAIEKKGRRPKHGARKLKEENFELLVKVDILNFIISKALGGVSYPSKEPYISTYEYLMSKIEFLEIIIEEQDGIIEEQAEEINKLKEENRKKQEEQAKKIKQLEEEIKRLKNNK